MLWQLIVLGIALGLNNAIASIALGTMNMKRSHQLRTAVLFGLFEAGMPILGLLIGSNLASVFGDLAKYIGIAILVILGLYLLVKKDGDDENQVRRPGLQTLILAFALSLDNLTVGFGLGMIQIPLELAAVVFGSISMVMTLIGLEIGHILGRAVSISAGKLSGAVLLLIAGAMLVF